MLTHSRFLPHGPATTLPALSAVPWQSRDTWFGSAIASFGGAHVDVSQPCVVIATIRSPRTRAITPELAKAVLDALHDRKHNPPHYRTTGLRAPLPDDDQRFVSGLAIELVNSPDLGVGFTLAPSLGLSGELIGSWTIDAAAPNDVAGSVSEEAARRSLRNQFARAVMAGLGPERAELTAATAVVVSHGPQRDEDNTWATWIGALTRGGTWLDPVGNSPLPGSWRPTAIASLSDGSLGARVRYDFLR